MSHDNATQWARVLVVEQLLPAGPVDDRPWVRVMALELPIKLETVNPPSHASRSFWRNVNEGKAIRAKAGPELVKFPQPSLPCCLRITRLVPPKGQFQDSDNAVRSCKALRDLLALWADVSDASPELLWCIRQERAAAAGVRIEAFCRGEAPHAA